MKRGTVFFFFLFFLSLPYSPIFFPRVKIEIDIFMFTGRRIDLYIIYRWECEWSGSIEEWVYLCMSGSGMVEETDREAGGDCGCSKGDERRK